MSVDDAIDSLEHDHDELSRDVRELAALLEGLERSATSPAHLAVVFAELRDELVMHLVREEERLLPYLTRHAPDLTAAVDDLIVIHDEICAAATRLVYFAESGSRADTLMPVFQRFEATFVKHVEAERTLFERAARTLTPAQRAELAHWVRTL